MNSATPQPPPLSLYVHLPWCESKCPYCDFNSHPLRQNLPEDDYLDALLVDLQQEKNIFKNRPVHSIFIGGGTPSLFSPAAVDRLLTAIREISECAQQIEITLEANPGAAEVDRFVGYLEAGVNRLSLGIQSFSDNKLRALGRIHDASQARHAISATQDAGFTNFNIDLMFGLPNQSEKGALEDLTTALSYTPSHLSLYQLTVEPNTYFAINPPTLPDEETDWRIRNVLYDLVKTNGYHRYEVSAFSKPGAQCRHNLSIWRFGDYVGLGAGAHGKVTTPQGIIRYAKEKHPNRYMEKACSNVVLAGPKTIPSEDLCFEFMLNALRLSEGFLPSEFTERTGVPWSALAGPLNDARSRGLLETHHGKVRATKLGYRFLDDLIELFLPKVEQHNAPLLEAS
jgi:oxygen-independent coproporphyrinogen-3 oxidase